MEVKCEPYEDDVIVLSEDEPDPGGELGESDDIDELDTKRVKFYNSRYEYEKGYLRMPGFGGRCLPE